jgi:hypothetical protein
MDLSPINPDLLQTFLLEQQSPVDELHLFKYFYPHVPFDLTNYNFFQAHFFIHHSLYQLKNQLIQQGYLIYIQLSSVYTLKIPEAGICSWFIQSPISFCGQTAENKFCSYHEKKNRELIGKGVVESDPLQEYYLNLKNLEELDEQSFRQFSESGIYLAENIMKVQQDLKVFALDPGAAFSRITSRFRYLVKESHPDSGGDSVYSFQEIKEAYDVLAAWKNQGQ